MLHTNLLKERSTPWVYLIFFFRFCFAYFEATSVSVCVWVDLLYASTFWQCVDRGGLCLLCPFLVSITFSVRIFSTYFTDWVPIGVCIIVPIGFVVDFMRSISNVFLPVSGPVQVFISQLGRRFGVTTHHHTINHTTNQRCESKYQKY